MEQREKKVTHFRYPRVLLRDPLPLSCPLSISLASVRRHRHHVAERSRTDGPESLNDSAFVQDRREAVRKIALSMMNSVRSARLRCSPRPPIGRERRDRERYRHEGTNYPPHHRATTIRRRRRRPPPPSATTPRFGARDEEGRTETEPPGRGRRDVEGPGWKGRNSGGRERARGA